MAVRIEFFTIFGNGDFELVPDDELAAAVSAYDAGTDPSGGGTVRCVGWLEASDDDEARFGGWCEELGDDLGVGLLHQGLGEDSGLRIDLVAAEPEDPEAIWAATIRSALTAADGGRIGWRTDFDVF